MSYKTIFTALTQFDAPTAALQCAMQLTDQNDGHLDVLCLGLDASRSNYYELGANAAVVQAAIEQTHKKAEAVRAGVSAYLEKSGLRWTATDALATITDAGRSVSLAARFSDLAVVPLPYGKDAHNDDPILLEALLFDAICPTLVVPEGVERFDGDTVVIGWNESREALRAVRAALPFLMAANTVQIAIIDPPEHAPDRSDPGGALAVYLSRHGVSSDIEVMSRSGGRVSERLNRHATEAGAGLVVMGAYGHSRFREAMLGGATRDMLEHAKMPILMAH